jgi:hypothetical protein
MQFVLCTYVPLNWETTQGMGIPLVRNLGIIRVELRLAIFRFYWSRCLSWKL